MLKVKAMSSYVFRGAKLIHIFKCFRPSHSYEWLMSSARNKARLKFYSRYFIESKTPAQERMLVLYLKSVFWEMFLYSIILAAWQRLIECQSYCLFLNYYVKIPLAYKYRSTGPTLLLYNIFQKYIVFIILFHRILIFFVIKNLFFPFQINSK